MFDANGNPHGLMAQWKGYIATGEIWNVPKAFIQMSCLISEAEKQWKLSVSSEYIHFHVCPFHRFFIM